MDARGVDARVLQPQRELGGARAAAGGAAHAPGEQLEVGVPDPGDVAPVGDLVVEHAEQVVLAGLERERAQHLVGAGGVLHEQDPQLAAPAGVGRSRAGRRSRRGRTRRCVACSPATISRQVDLERGRERGGGERVVDVVEAGQRERDLGLAGGRAQREAGRAHALRGVTSRRADRRRGAASGRSSGSGSGRGGRGRRRRTRTARRSGGSASRRRRAPCPAARASRPRRRSTATGAVALAAEVGDQRVVGVEHERRSRAGPLSTAAAQRSAIVSSSP